MQEPYHDMRSCARAVSCYEILCKIRVIQIRPTGPEKKKKTCAQRAVVVGESPNPPAAKQPPLTCTCWQVTQKVRGYKCPERSLLSRQKCGPGPIRFDVRNSVSSSHSPCLLLPCRQKTTASKMHPLPPSIVTPDFLT